MAKLLALLWMGATLHAAGLRYWVEPCSQPETGCRAGDPELAGWAMEAWQAASGGKLTLEQTSDVAKAHIRVFWASASGGLYGEAVPIMVDGVPGAKVYVTPAVVSANEPDALLRDAIVYLTCLHETGHALGLQHTAEFDDIMYSFEYGGDIPEYFGRYRRQLSARADIRKHPGMSEHDRQRLAARWH